MYRHVSLLNDLVADCDWSEVASINDVCGWPYRADPWITLANIFKKSESSPPKLAQWER